MALCALPERRSAHRKDAATPGHADLVRGVSSNERDCWFTPARIHFIFVHRPRAIPGSSMKVVRRKMFDENLNHVVCRRRPNRHDPMI